jgi:hypothetical protein
MDINNEKVKAKKVSSFQSNNNEKSDVETYSIEQQQEAPFVKSEAERKLVKKLNWTFMPFVCLIVFIQVSILLDKCSCISLKCSI